MTVTPSINPALPWFEQIDGAEPDVLRSLLKTFVEALMSAEADAICGAPYGVRSEDRVNSRNGPTSRTGSSSGGVARSGP
jgi:putative transposase